MGNVTYKAEEGLERGQLKSVHIDINKQID